MNTALPREFTDSCSEAQRIEAEAWWSDLETTSQSDIYVLLDTRNESRAFVLATDEKGERGWHTLPIVDDSLPDERDTDEDDESWITELLHYRLDHEDFVMASDLKVRTFHICSQHAAAQEVIAAGELTNDFRCSDCNPSCPILQFASKLKHGILLKHNPKTNFSVWLSR